MPTTSPPRSAGSRASQRRVQHRAGGDADRQPLQPGAAAGHGERVALGHPFHRVEPVELEHGGAEAGTDALDVVRPRLVAGEHGALRRLHADHPQSRAARLQRAGDAGQRAAGADAADHHVDRAAGIVQISSAVVARVDLGVGGVVELPRHPGAGRGGDDRLGPGDGAGHAAPRGVSSSSAPMSRSILRRSMLAPSGMTTISR